MKTGRIPISHDHDPIIQGKRKTCKVPRSMQNANMTKKANRIEIIDRKDITENSNRSMASPERKRKVMASRATGRKTRLDGQLDQPDRRVGDISFSWFRFWCDVQSGRSGSFMR
jgi:hypothetical protein